jgi:protein SCO1/2
MKRAAVVALLAIALACAQKEKPLSVAGEKLYAMKGKIVARDAKDNTLRLDHEAIPGFMEAMTMDYSVRGAKVALLPADGSRVTAKLHVTDSAYWVTDVAKAP